MEKKRKLNWLWLTLSYILVVAVTVAVTVVVVNIKSTNKLSQLQRLLEQRFIGEVDSDALEDAAANAMVNALGDRWSYYITAEEYAAYEEQKNNAYVGVGITIQVTEDQQGFLVIKVEEGGSAKEQGILPGDVITEVAGQSISQIGTEKAQAEIRGEKGTTVSVAVLRNGEKLTFTLTRKTIQTPVATAQMLEGNVGLVTIRNFNNKCADESINAVKKLLNQGAEAIIFDVRNNPGGYQAELVKLLDYLLPEGKLFCSVDYTGKESTDWSDAACLEIPMAVLVNGESYSAAEFFAAALDEYDWATVVGEQTCGKGYFQVTYQFNDGSAVGLSIGKYFTPIKGVSLAETGGLTPEIEVDVDDRTAALIYSGLLEPEEDPQIQAALQALQNP